jgi:putative FmdB family regulatory protein
MPHYEFFCNACKQTFLKIETIAEHDTDKPACPHCGSAEARKAYLVGPRLEPRLRTACNGAKPCRRSVGQVTNSLRSKNSRAC